MDADREDVRSAVLKLVGRAKKPKPREMNAHDRTLLAIYQHDPKDHQELAATRHDTASERHRVPLRV